MLLRMNSQSSTRASGLQQPSKGDWHDAYCAALKLKLVGQHQGIQMAAGRGRLRSGVGLQHLLLHSSALAAKPGHTWWQAD